mgnify:CR=1 FL=1
MKNLESLIKTYNDFPKKGIAFKDILGIIQDPEVIKNLNNLYSLYKSLEKNRAKRNAISFDSNEVSFFLSKSNEIESIKSSARMESQKIIEECMIAANIASSLFIKKINASAKSSTNIANN